MPLQEKIELHKRFWSGEGPCLILIPPAEADICDTESYAAKFNDPELMWESEMRQARAVLDSPTDGIPTVRPNLGVIFIPAIAGLGYMLKEGQMPWPGDPLSKEVIRAAADPDLSESRVMQLAVEFYKIHRERGNAEAVAYQADTQGVFDVAHLLYGDDIFYELADESQHAWVRELMDISVELCIHVTQEMKKLLGESDGSMIHGHGTSQGIYFKNAGLRICEDTATLLSPGMIEEFVMPYIEREMAPFEGAFLHYCGKHDFLFERLCRCGEVRAIDLGNPESYDPRWLLEKCAGSGTILFSHVAAEDGEDWRAYIQRIARLVKTTGARCILRPAVHPKTRAECADMLHLWHELTSS